MKCPKCKKDNKAKAVKCRFCGAILEEELQPSWQWNLKVLAIIYAVLIALYILVKVVV